MGKKTRKTRWRALAIADESDSEESNTLSGSQLSKNYHHRPFYSKFTHSSQSTPTRRFPYEPKSTRSSSTASENKITFNEDEYTKITTPRQDVLFKKGYLSKPKSYQTQTSTGNSTASTGNSTGNGTPDHQSADGTEGTDLEYESQFVFPNAFVDQNGIYYINSYEHYPMVLYNPQICYPEYPVSRTKRHSTGSLTESTSPHTEETSQDLSQSGGENTGNGPEFNHVYNIIYPGYYFNGACNSNVTTNGQAATEPRKIKKKRRRKISKSINQEDTTSSEDGYSSDEAITQVENRIQSTTPLNTDTKTYPKLDGCSITENVGTETSASMVEENKNVEKENKENNDDSTENQSNELSWQNKNNSSSQDTKNVSSSLLDSSHSREEEIQEELLEENNANTEELSNKDETERAKDLHEETNIKPHEISPESISKSENTQQDDLKYSTDNPVHPIRESRFNLNAQEFVPRAYRNVEPTAVDSNLQFINIHPNFVPLTLINHHLNELNPPNFSPPFLPPGISLNFMATDPKVLPNFVNFVPNHFVSPKSYEQSTNSTPPKVTDAVEQGHQLKTKTDELKTEDTEEMKEAMDKQDVCNEKPDVEKPKHVIYKNDVDIAKIVSKLEEAAKEQKLYENRRQDFRSPNKFNKLKSKYNSTYQNDYQQDIRHVDKRRLRRFDNNSNENSHSNQKQATSPLKEEILNLSEGFQKKSEEIKTEPQIKVESRELTIKSNEEERKYLPRHQPTKNQDSPRRYMNYNRNIKNRSLDVNYFAHGNEYTDTLKKPSYNKLCPRFEKIASERINTATKQTPKKKIDESIKDVKTKPINVTNQWISVSNRKKRKNRSVNDDDIENARDDTIENSEVFETFYDTKSQDKQLESSSLETFVDSEQKSSNDNLSSSIKVDNFIEMITKNESTSMKMCSNNDVISDQVILQDIQDIEEELLKDSIKIVNIIGNERVNDIPKIEQNEASPIQTKMQKEVSKKKKKSSGKNSTKRIIILDPDVSKKQLQERDMPKTKINTENPPASEDTETNVSIAKPTDNLSSDKYTESFSEQKQDRADNELTPEILSENIATPDKKKNKKKKKQLKPCLITSTSSVSSSSTTLNNVDDSYDFLLDTTALIEEKTNVEVSEELDKMIQRGLFGNLEEKFKSLNVSVDNDFFKSLSLKSKPQSTPEKGFIKATNFTTILNSVNQPLPKSTNDDHSKIDMDFSKIKLPDEPQPSTSKMGVFLDKLLPEDTVVSEEIEVKLNSKSNGKLKNKSKKRISDIASNKAVLQDANYFTNNGTENKMNTTNQIVSLNNDENISMIFFRKTEENNANLNDDLMEVKAQHTCEPTNQDKTVQNKVLTTNVSSDTCQHTHLKPQAEIPSTELLNERKNHDAFDTKAIVNNEIVKDCLRNDVDQAKIPNEEHIVIKIDNIESTEDLSLENAIGDENVIKKTENKSVKDNHFINEEYPKNFSDMGGDVKPLYPITQAVKEWMTKTRETTPEIEILKSPDTIYKEFIEYSEEEDCNSDAETDQKNGKSNPSFIEYLDQTETCQISTNARVAKFNIANDVTVCETWSMSQDASIQDDDLLDCWEPDTMEVKKAEFPRKNEPIEEGEDVLEVYESKYGKNDDFLRLKAEIEEHKRNGTFPKHSNLPYRAICCSLM